MPDGAGLKVAPGDVDADPADNSNYYGLRINQSNTGNIREQAKFTLTDTLTLYPGLRLGELHLRSQDRFITADPRNGDDSGAQRLHHALPVIGLGLQLVPLTQKYSKFVGVDDKRAASTAAKTLSLSRQAPDAPL